MSDVHTVEKIALGELIVDVIVGSQSVERAAEILDIPKGQVLGWCDRVKDQLKPRNIWQCQIGEVDVQHLASWDGEIAEDALVTFEVVVANHSATTLYGVHLVERSFTNADMDDLELETCWKLLEGSQASLLPGARQRYRATYRINSEDIVSGGPLINAITMTGRTAAGQLFVAQRDALVPMPEAPSTRFARGPWSER